MKLDKERQRFYNRFNSRRYHTKQLEAIKKAEQHKLDVFNERLKNEGLECLIKPNVQYFKGVL